MTALTPGREKIALTYLEQIQKGAKSIDDIPATVPSAIVERVRELLDEWIEQP